MYDVKKMFRHDANLAVKEPLRSAPRRGFTIVEVMVAATVMVLALSSSLIVMQQGMRAIDTARSTTLAGQVLQSQIEKLRLLTWTQLTNTTYGPVSQTTFTPDLSPALVSRFYVGTTTGVCAQVIEEHPVLGAFMKKITLTATWKGIDGKSHSLSYITYYGQYGLSDFFWPTR
jgi:prepilin-type N-terminal cleavage/methylation domain-containing protein